jgi:uncharacterized protein (DUF697 family)
MSVSKKKLPNAIIHPIDGMREAVAADRSREWRGALTATTAPNQSANGEAVSAPSGPMGEVIEKTQASAVPVKATSTRGARTFAETNLAKRQAQARAIVARHAAYSAVGGILPLPVASVAGITTIIIRMVKMLSNLYGVPFERDRARAIIVGLVGGTVPTGFATVATSTLFFVVPSGALMGLVVSSFTAIACTRSIGQIFIEHFESGATLHDLSIKESR